jgi:putative lipoic acid-binding regulatory protein
MTSSPTFGPGVPGQPDPRRDSLIDYPCAFPIKVMGRKVDGFVHAMTAIALRHDASFDAATIELRDSKAGNYLGVTLTIRAVSREQLDALYLDLTSHPLVKVVL